VCKAGEVSFTLVGKVNSLLIGFDALVLLLVVVTLLVRLLGPHLAHLRQVTHRSRALASPLFYLLALAAVIVGVIEPRAGWALGGVALGILGAVLAPGD
jgi:hypothetical protein